MPIFHLWRLPLVNKGFLQLFVYTEQLHNIGVLMDIAYFAKTDTCKYIYIYVYIYIL